MPKSDKGHKVCLRILGKLVKKRDATHQKPEAWLTKSVNVVVNHNITTKVALTHGGMDMGSVVSDA